MVAQVKNYAAVLHSNSTEPETRAHDEVIHALATARIRAYLIAGSHNPAEAILMAGIQAVNKANSQWQQTQHWAMPPEDQKTMYDAIEAYETILMASSPLQMEEAYRVHITQLTNYLKSIEN